MINGKRNSFNTKTYSKINLFLHVLGKREDGYHDIYTLFYAIELHDELSVTLSDKLTLACNDKSIPADERNIILKVDRILRQNYSLKDKYEINLIKNIPSGAGLGGGSGNAAGYLKLVNKASNLGLSFKDMENILAQVGSDTCFFLYNGAAVGEGRGEILTPVNNIPELKMLLINPKIHISTAEVYGSKNLKLTQHASLPRINDLKGLDSLVGLMNNDMQPAAQSICPLVGKLCNELEAQNALKAMMSGSGSTVFGLYKDDNSLDLAYKYFHSKYPEFMVIKTKGLKRD